MGSCASCATSCRRARPFPTRALQGFPVWHSAIVATGLLTASALVVHISGGYVEAHFHFFVMIVVLTLYSTRVHRPARERRRRLRARARDSRHGAALGMVVVAEGIETEEQASVLRELGCERAQGYALARPAAAEVIFELVSPARAVPSSAPHR